MALYLLIGGLALATGFLSGLLGIGGGIILAPLLLYIPPLIGLEPLSMHVVAGLTIVQGLVACVAGGFTHRKFNFVSSRLSLYMGVSIFVAALIGGGAARLVSNRMMLLIFACLALTAAIVILRPVREEDEAPDIDQLDFCRIRAVLTATGVGLVGGLVGQGGSFILIPLMISFVHIPTRIAIGSNMAIVALSSLAGFLGKAFTGQIEWLLTVPVIIGVIPAAILGSFASRKVPAKGLRQLLAVLIAAAAVRIFLSLGQL